ncbi:hypothetical protein P7C70_g5206, partial [Phenoliferia sp. Uapishka_3]
MSYLADSLTHADPLLSRYDALFASLGFASPEELEDYILVHGICTVIPRATVQTDPSLLQDTQLLSQQPQTSTSSRNLARKIELSNARSLIDRLQKELEYARKEADEVARGDKRRIKLFELTEARLRKELEEVKADRERLRSKLDGTTDEAEVERLRQENEELEKECGWLEGEVVPRCYRSIEELETEVVALRKICGIEIDSEERRGEQEEDFATQPRRKDRTRSFGSHPPPRLAAHDSDPPAADVDVRNPIHSSAPPAPPA